jgi:N-acetylglucosaminyldiphosphoundecaprenol N-acetyl-beta-D-mannosaminyltransferase
VSHAIDQPPQEISAAADAPATEHDTVQVLGLTMHPVTFDEILGAITPAIESRKQFVMGHHNAHSAYVFQRSKGMQRFYEKASLIYVDSMPLLMLARCLGYKVDGSCRVTLVDYLAPLLEHAAKKGWHIYFIGARPGVAERGFASFVERWPELKITVRHGYFNADPDSEENSEVVAEINAAKPDLLLVGFGMPRQEEWIDRNASLLDVPVLWPCGGTLDYFAGEIKLPPRWMGRAGLEWLYRLYAEPSRLWRRYLLEPWALVPLLARDVWQHVSRQNGRANRRK